MGVVSWAFVETRNDFLFFSCAPLFLGAVGPFAAVCCCSLAFLPGWAGVLKGRVAARTTCGIAHFGRGPSWLRGLSWLSRPSWLLRGLSWLSRPSWLRGLSSRSGVGAFRAVFLLLLFVCVVNVTVPERLLLFFVCVVNVTVPERLLVRVNLGGLDMPLSCLKYRES
jgi:hypothetical protein